MCVSPIRVKNPYKGVALTKFTKLHDCTAEFINVPCGHCCECLANKQMQITQRIQMELQSHYAYFFTLTYSNAALPVLREYVNTEGEVLSLDKPISYADMTDITLMMKRLRNNDAFGRPFKYLVCSERGSKKHRPHFHGFIFIDRRPGDDIDHVTKAFETIIYNALFKEWRRLLPGSSKKKPIYEPLFEYHEKFVGGVLKRNFDCHYVNPASTTGGEMDVAFYVTKYIFKADDYERRLKSAIFFNYPDDYKTIWNIVKSQNRRSLGLGLDSDYSKDLRKLGAAAVTSDKVYAHIRKHVISSEAYPTYCNSLTGQLFPLASYYRRLGHLFTLDDIETLYQRYNPDGGDWNRLEDTPIRTKTDDDRQKDKQREAHSRLDHRLDDDITFETVEIASDFLDDDFDEMIPDAPFMHYDADPHGTLASLRYCFDLEPTMAFCDDLPNTLQDSIDEDCLVSLRNCMPSFLDYLMSNDLVSTYLRASSEKRESMITSFFNHKN